MLPRILEPELMDTAEDASEYDAMDHSDVNSQFVTDLLGAVTDWLLQRPVESTADDSLKVLDLGAGTAQIPIELARRAPFVHITAVDAAASMLAVARNNVSAAKYSDRIELVLGDAKNLAFDAATFPVVISNSIVHHIGEPHLAIAEAVRVCASDGVLFHRDLARPCDENQLQQIVTTYAGNATPYQRRLFANSLRAALTPDEVQLLIAEHGFARETVRMTSDRHWTWVALKQQR